MRWISLLMRPVWAAQSGFAGTLASALVLSLCQTPSALAHEFWLVPVTTSMTAGSVAHVGVKVGEFFNGEPVGWSLAQTVSLGLHTADGTLDMLPLLAMRGVTAELSVPLRKAGTTMLTFDSQPNFISLPADTFHAYLHYEGLDFIKARRVATGDDKKPGRERYRRFVKTLIRVVPADQAAAEITADTSFSRVTGQQLEIVPLNDPLAIVPGDDLRVKLLFEGKPLAGALVKAWHRKEGQFLVVHATTAADGTATVTLPHPGAWMVSVVHMVPAVGVKDTDWDSLWANVSFGLAPSATGK